MLAVTHGDLTKQPFNEFCREVFGKLSGFHEEFHRSMKRLNVGGCPAS
jgi:hypothetical protein